MISSGEDILKYIKDNSFKKIFVLCGKKSFVNSGAENLLKNIDIPIQGGLNPEILLSNKEILRKEIKNYLDIFKDHPYVFNLGHGILPETQVDMVYELVDIVRNYK